jgi:elongation factor G
MAEDPTFRSTPTPRPGQTVIRGMGELHLEIIVDRLKREFNVEANVGKPQVAYKETLTMPAEGEGRYVRQTGGRGQYGHAKMRVEPRQPTARASSSSTRSSAASIPREFIKPIEQGIKEAMERGMLAGYPMDDVKRRALRRLVPRRRLVGDGLQDRRVDGLQGRPPEGAPGAARAGDAVEVVVPEEYMGDIMGDLSAAAESIQSMEERGGTQIVNARVPLSEMFGYATDLRSRTQGRATYTMHFDRYEQAPKNVSRGSRREGAGQGNKRSFELRARS